MKPLAQIWHPTAAVLTYFMILANYSHGEEPASISAWDRPLERKALQLHRSDAQESSGITERRFADSEETTFYLQQNWTAEESLEFYSLRQGSPLMNREFFNALEQPDGDGLFRDSSFLATYGFLPQLRHAGNPDGYPIGLVGTASIELNCSACHTSRMRIDGKEYRIDGGQAGVDMQSWLRDLALAMQLTLADAPTLQELEDMVPTQSVTLNQSTRFGRFAKRVLGAEQVTVSRIYAVLSLLERQYARRQRYNDFNDYGRRFDSHDQRAAATKNEQYGPGRLDALGAILNQACCEMLKLERNAAVANAPVNFPAIWDAPQHKHVQWNGAVDNTTLLGPLGRNAGQVIGVFGLVEPQGDTFVGYDSSIRFEALERAEALITKLWSPPWPSEFGIDLPQASRGKTVYAAKCMDCHALMKRDDPTRQANDALIPIESSIGNYPKLGTDPTAAKNWNDRKAIVGLLAGRYVTRPLGARFPNQTEQQVPAREILTHLVFGSIARSFVPWRDELTLDSPSRHGMLAVESATQTLMRYKSRPLNGVWSTAPYLHNGSVLNMVELLTPPGDRKTSFRVGTIEYDPATLGFKDEGRFLFQTTKPGNSNAGHSYGTELSDADKKALLEYLKTL